MFERLRRALVGSYVGAIGLGYMLAQAIMHFVNIFAAPITAWVARRQYGEMVSSTKLPLRGSWEYAAPELVKFLALTVVWYLLMRWLYFGKHSSGGAKPE